MHNIHNTQLFQDMLPHFVIQYDAATRGSGRLRPRIEIKKMPAALTAKALSFTCECPACGRQMHPFRVRAGKGDSRGAKPEPIYYAAGCQHIPEQSQLKRWKKLAGSQSSTQQDLAEALQEVVDSCRNCCKGKKCNEAYRAFARAIRSAQGAQNALQLTFPLTATP
jgi:hypothetical protein